MFFWFLMVHPAVIHNHLQVYFEKKKKGTTTQPSFQVINTSSKPPVVKDDASELKVKYSDEKNVVKISDHADYLDSLFSLINPNKKKNKPADRYEVEIDTDKKDEIENLDDQKELLENEIVKKNNEHDDDLEKIESQNLFDNVIPNQHLDQKNKPEVSKLAQLIVPMKNQQKNQLIIPNIEEAYQTKVLYLCTFILLFLTLLELRIILLEFILF